MLLLFACMLALAAAKPVYFDQRQEGDFNFRADVENIMLIIAYPKKLSSSLYDVLAMGEKGNVRKAALQDRSDSQVMEAFVEPNTPYQVEIGTTKQRQADSDSGKVEVVIAGRRRLDSDQEVEKASGKRDEMKLLGATEQCGPERERDPVTLTCRSIRSDSEVGEATSEKKGEKVESQPTPEVVAS